MHAGLKYFRNKKRPYAAALLMFGAMPSVARAAIEAGLENGVDRALETPARRASLHAAHPRTPQPTARVDFACESASSD